jgi:hypothetical protein
LRKKSRHFWRIFCDRSSFAAGQWRTGRSIFGRARLYGPAKAIQPGLPKGFLWGAATAGHQVEGNNTTSDLWYLENLKPTIFAQPSGDAANSFLLWQRPRSGQEHRAQHLSFQWNGRGSNR